MNNQVTICGVDRLRHAEHIVCICGCERWKITLAQQQFFLNTPALKRSRYRAGLKLNERDLEVVGRGVEFVDLVGSAEVVTCLMNQYCPKYKKIYAWFALVGFLGIAITSFALPELKKIAVPLFHGVAGLIIFLLPFLVKDAPKGFWWVGIGGALIGLGGIALAFLTVGSQLLFFSQSFVLVILAPLLLLMTIAFAIGFMKDIKATTTS